MVAGNDDRLAVLEDVGMTEKQLKEGVDELRTWLKQQSHLPQFPDDHMLEVFLVGSKRMENAKRKLEFFFAARTKLPRFFKSRCPADIDWDTVYDVAYLPGVTPQGYKVMYVRLPADCSKLDLVTALKQHMLLTETMMKDEPINSGHVCVVDCSDLSLPFLGHLSVSALKDVCRVYFSAYPIRVKGTICFNSPQLAHIMMNTFVRPFFPKKLKKRVIVLKGDHSAIDMVPVEMMPCDYPGGCAPSVAELVERSRQRLIELSDWFADEGTACADLSHLPPDSYCCIQ